MCGADFVILECGCARVCDSVCLFSGVVEIENKPLSPDEKEMRVPASLVSKDNKATYISSNTLTAPIISA